MHLKKINLNTHCLESGQLQEQNNIISLLSIECTEHMEYETVEHSAFTF